MTGQRWLLPDGIEEWLPAEAERAEKLRRELLDLYALWGYRLVAPPMLEYLESLLTGFGSDLDLQTFKVIDQHSGRLMGLRADVTSQVARIDAHSLRDEGTARLCYCESVLHARAASAFASRAPKLIGAELFGAASPAADAEVIALLAETLALAGAEEARIELGHVGISRALLAELRATLPGEPALTATVHARLFDALQRKSTPDLELCLSELSIDGSTGALLLALPALMGELSVLERAERLFADGPLPARAAVAELRAVATQVERYRPGTRLQFDLCELSGYTYHTGTLFAAYVPSHGRAIARGGRYDGIGAAFGRSRPATGYDVDLGTLSAFRNAAAAPPRVAAPEWPLDPAQANALRARIGALRSAGTQVLYHVEDSGEASLAVQLRLRDGDWVVEQTASVGVAPDVPQNTPEATITADSGVAKSS